MPTERNAREIEVLTDKFSSASIVISTDFRGLGVRAMDRFRRALRKGSARYRITKNTLALIAADRAERPEIKEIVDGPSGYVMTEGDPAEAAKALMDHIRAERLDMTVRGAVLGSDVLDAARFETFAALPSREELMSRVLGQMNAPIAGLVTVLSGPVRALATVLQRHVDQIGGAEPSDAEPSTEEA